MSMLLKTLIHQIRTKTMHPKDVPIKKWYTGYLALVQKKLYCSSEAEIDFHKEPAKSSDNKAETGIMNT